MSLRVLCAGDRFITPETLAAAARAAWPDAQIRHLGSRWPDEPFRSVDGVHEAAGEVAELAAAMHDVDVLLTHLAPVTEAVLAGAHRLRIVGSVRGGPVNVDLDAATRSGVPVTFLPGRNLGAVAEFVLGVMLVATRGIVPAAAALAVGQWDASAFRIERTGNELRCCTVGLVGLGAVGARVAQLLHAFGARVVAYDPYAATPTDGVELVDTLEALLAVSEVVSVHARLTDETRGMFDDAAFEAMRPGACFVNTARGELVDEAALARALASGRVGCAALDVFSPEPPSAANPLLGDPRVLATPHLAGASRQVAQESASKVVAAVARYLAGQGLEHCANPSVLQRTLP